MAVFDMDTHLRDEYFFDEIYRLEGEFAQYTPRRIGDGRLHFSKFENQLDPWGKEVGGRFNHELMYNPEKKWRGGRVAESQRGGYDMDYRLADNEREGIDYQFIFPTHISVATLPEGRLGSAVARAYNDWAAKLVKGKEERLWPVAMMPAGHPEGMVAELRRCVKELGCKAAHLVPYSLTRTLDDPAYEPFYAEAAKMGVPLFLHPASFGPLINNHSNFYAMHVLGRPFNCTAGLVALTTGGVFERNPGLNVAFFECGAEWILYWMHRMDDDYKNMQFGFAPQHHEETVRIRQEKLLGDLRGRRAITALRAPGIQRGQCPDGLGLSSLRFGISRNREGAQGARRHQPETERQDPDREPAAPPENVKAQPVT